ncbi:MAG TPA: hypothetical protein ENH82_04100 [bacterium]|nr:hypothetical protein [bacterium]
MNGASNNILLLDNLENELEKLLIFLKSEANSDEHFVEIKTVAEIKKAALNNNESEVLELLASISEWSIEIAEKIGLEEVINAYYLSRSL